MITLCPSCDQLHSDKQPHHCTADPFTPGLFAMPAGFDPGPPLGTMPDARCDRGCARRAGHGGRCESVEER